MKLQHSSKKNKIIFSYAGNNTDISNPDKNS
jgi:hypothetical protein